MHGLYLLWWVQEKHVPAAIVAALLAAGDFAITALEIPTGWLADRYGHRASLIAGSLAQVAGMMLCWLGQGVFGLLSAILLVAIGDAFRSGADQALLYRSCVALDRERDFQSIESRTRGLQLAALVAMTLGGGAIVARWGFAVGWMAEAAACAVGLAVAWAMIEPPACDTAPPDDDAEAAARGSADAGASGAVTADRRPSGAPARRSARTTTLVALIAPAAILDSLSAGASFLAQTGGASDPRTMAVLVAVITLAEAAGAVVAARLPATLRGQLLLAGAGIAATVGALVLPAAFLPAVLALSFLTGAAGPLRAAAIQRLAADHVRARAASIASACDRAGTTVALLVAAALPRGR